MTTNEFLKIERWLQLALPEFAVKGRLMFVSPAEGLLRGIYFEGSEFNKTSFYIRVFILPLCVPTRSLYFNFGKRLQHLKSDRWSLHLPDLNKEILEVVKKDAVPFISRVDSMLEFVNLVKTFSIKNPHTMQALAYGLARVGQFDEAHIILEKLIHKIDKDVPWQVEILNRAVALKDHIAEKPAEVQRMLLAWETRTVQDLGIEN